MPLPHFSETMLLVKFQPNYSKYQSPSFVFRQLSTQEVLQANWNVPRDLFLLVYLKSVQEQIAIMHYSAHNAFVWFLFSFTVVVDTQCRGACWSSFSADKMSFNPSVMFVLPFIRFISVLFTLCHLFYLKGLKNIFRRYIANLIFLLVELFPFWKKLCPCAVRCGQIKNDASGRISA